MEIRRTIAALAGFALVAACSARDGVADPLPRAHNMIVVELFESQGCSSCPPANANVNALSGRSDLLTLIYGVTYWDQLGWRDTFARPEFTARQRDYQRGLGNDNVYTPQVVLNGRRDLVGVNRAQLDSAITHAGADTFAAEVTLTGNVARVAGQPLSASGADVWLVRYDPRTLEVPIRAGENNGRTLPHVHVVRELKRLGVWTGGAHEYSLPHAAEAGLRTAILVQLPEGGAIIGAGHDE